MIFSNAAATVYEGPRSASASYVISLIAAAPVFGPFRGDMVHLGRSGDARDQGLVRRALAYRLPRHPDGPEVVHALTLQPNHEGGVD